ncbi:MAG TPA: hypothetical protein VM840_06955 [Actinomycetota bacterium]|nr:hypothetical protein [Actinomycetota bacterium]
MIRIVLLVVALTLTGCASDLPTASPSPHPELGEPAEGFDDPEGAVRALVDEFMEARLSGSGAEVHLTPVAQEQYASGSPALYDPSYRGWELRSLEAADANSYEVEVVIERSDGGPLSERLGVGPGDNVEGRPTPYLVRFAMAA